MKKKEITHYKQHPQSHINKVILAYSGGLDTSAIVPWLIENYQCKVIAFVADVGQGHIELEGIEEKALNSGASECYIVDLKSAFVDDIIFPALKCGIEYEDGYLLGTALARPIIAKAQVELALQLGANAVAHGCTGKGNDQVRFETIFSALAPELTVIAPWREWALRSREDLLNYLYERNIPTSASAQKLYSRDANLWHLSHEGGELENTENIASDAIWMLSSSVKMAPSEPEVIELEFEQGAPVSLNGLALDGVEIISKLNSIAGKHCIGRIDIIENRLVGIKSRGCYETPAGTVIIEALKGLEQLVLDRDAKQLKKLLTMQIAPLIYDGKWYTNSCQSLLAAGNNLQSRTCGKISLSLFKGQVTAIRKQSAQSLYSEQMASFTMNSFYSQKDAEGFINIVTLSQKVKALKEKGLLS
jgi:argininosuccinate synthase